MLSSEGLAREVHRRLLRVYGRPKWRRPMPPLDELVSTILSQNTNDLNRDRAYQALRARFPTWEAARDAPPQEVVQTIRPAGLANRKGPRIQGVLKAISDERGSLDLGFLRDLRESGNAFYSVRRCAITRTGIAATGTSIVPRLRAECDIDLITIIDRAAKA